MMKPEVSFCGERTSPPSGLAPGRTSSAWRAPSAASAPPHAQRDCSASPLPACFPCHHSFVFSPISPHPHLLPPKKKITGKKEEREGRSLHWGGTGGVLPTISVSRSGILQRALCARAAFCGTRSDGCEPAQGTGLT